MDKLSFLEDYKELVIRHKDIKRIIQSPDVLCPIELGHLHQSLNETIAKIREMEELITISE